MKNKLFDFFKGETILKFIIEILAHTVNVKETSEYSYL